jgi:hypothetical protein
MNNEFLQLLAEEAVKSPIIARKIADSILPNSSMLDTLIEKIDSDTLGKAIAERIIYYSTRGKAGQMADNTMAKYVSIIKRAEERAQEIVAEHIAQEVMNQ